MTSDAKIIPRALRLWVHYLPANLLFGAIAALPMLLAAFSDRAPDRGGARRLLIFGPYCLGTIAAGLMMPLVRSDWYGGSPSLGAALRLGFNRWRVIVWSGLLATAVPVVLYATHLGIDALFGPSRTYGGHGMPLNGVTLGDALWLPWAVLLILSVQAAFWFVPVAVAEGLGPVCTIHRSVTFAGKYWVTVFALVVLVSILIGTVAWVIGATVPFEATQPAIVDTQTASVFAVCSTMLTGFFGMILAVAYDEIDRARMTAS